MSERFFRSSRPGYPHPVSSELENSGIRVAVGDCSVTERRRWRPPYQTGKTVHVHAKHYIHDEDGRTAPGVCGNGSVPLSHSGNVVTRIGTHTAGADAVSFFFLSVLNSLMSTAKVSKLACEKWWLRTSDGRLRLKRIVITRKRELRSNNYVIACAKILHKQLRIYCVADWVIL